MITKRSLDPLEAEMVITVAVSTVDAGVVPRLHRFQVVLENSAGMRSMPAALVVRIRSMSRRLDA